MLRCLNTLAALRRDEKGVTALEYGLIAALVAVVIIGAVTSLGSNLSTTFTNIGDQFGSGKADGTRTTGATSATGASSASNAAGAPNALGTARAGSSIVGIHGAITTGTVGAQSAN